MTVYPFVAVLISILTVANGASRFALEDGDVKRTTVGTTVRYKEPLSSEDRAKQIANCDGRISQELIQEIASYRPVANQIIDLFTSGVFKGRAYNELAKLVDVYPIRMSGEKNLEDSIDYMMKVMTDEMKLEHVRGEQVLVPHWRRGEEKATLLEPFNKNIRLLGLGTTVGTRQEGITHEVLVVKNFEELRQKQALAKGKIVVYNQGWLGSYGATNVYRTRGASEASVYGAVATLIESVGPFSLDTPHTGGQTYWANVTQIPTACITKEDANLLYRLQQKGQRIMINLKMLDYNLPMTTSRNVIGEIAGRLRPDEYVAVSGHIDSWDVGQGAMDDAGGVMVSAVALAGLKYLELRPNRTLQVILWTAEEPGLWGVEDFARQHTTTLANYSAVFESDGGTFRPLGLDFAGTEEAGCIVQHVLRLVDRINATQYQRFPLVSSDITVLQAKGVPGISLANQDDMYFWYHHTEADTLSMQDPTEMDLDAALFAVSSYVLADLSVKLPRQ